MAPRKSFQNVPASTAVNLIEKTVLLELFSTLPGGLSDAGPPVKASERDEHGRVLSLRQENDIVSTLAFLSRVSNDPNHIPAVCLEEIPEEGACKVLVAVNKLRPDSGQAVLEKIQRGFEQIFRRLSTISSGMSHQTPRRGYLWNHTASILEKLW